MIYPVNGKISALWKEPRPLSAPQGERDHPHGAIDISARVNRSIIAPEDGELIYYCAVRSDKTQKWDEVKMDGKPFPFQNYFYDLYGTVLFLKGVSGLWHVMCHSYWNQIFNRIPVQFTYQEQKEDDRFPIFAYHNIDNPVSAKAGQQIGAVGNAGYSTGSHVHYEIHEGVWQKHEDRPDPELICRRF